MVVTCKVLVGPIATDRAYDAGEVMELDNPTAEQFAGWGLVEVVVTIDGLPVEAHVDAAPATETTSEVIAPTGIISEPVISAIPEVITPVEIAELIPVETVVETIAPVEAAPVFVEATLEVTVPTEVVSESVAPVTPEIIELFEAAPAVVEIVEPTTPVISEPEIIVSTETIEPTLAKAIVETIAPEATKESVVTEEVVEESTDSIASTTTARKGKK